MAHDNYNTKRYYEIRKEEIRVFRTLKAERKSKDHNLERAKAYLKEGRKSMALIFFRSYKSSIPREQFYRGLIFKYMNMRLKLASSL